MGEQLEAWKLKWPKALRGSSAAQNRGLRRRRVIDETQAECDPAAADRICEHYAGLAIPLQINFAVSRAGTGAWCARFVQRCIAASASRPWLAAPLPHAAIEAELKSTVAGLLLHSQLALSGNQIPGPVADRLRVDSLIWWQALAPAVRRPIAWPRQRHAG